MAAQRVYRPSALLRMLIRLEDFTLDSDPNLATEARVFDAKLQKAQARVTSLQNQLGQASAPSGRGTALDRAAVKRQLIQEQKKASKIRAKDPRSRVVNETPGDQFSIELITVPIELTVEMNSFRIADTMQATFPFKDAPLVSDIIRAAQVDVFMGTVPEESFGDPGNWLLTRGRSVIMFRGYVDTWDTVHDDANSRIQIQCRSLESVLIDGKINPIAPAYRIKGAGEKISVYVNRILQQYPPTAGIGGGDQFKAAWYGADPAQEPILDRRILARSLQTAKSRNQSQAPEPVTETVVTPAVANDGTDVGQTEGAAPDSDVRMPTKSPSQEMTIWDLITQACELAGCIPTYDPSLPAREGVNPLDTLLLRPTQTLFEDTSGGAKVKGGPFDEFSREFANPETGESVRAQIRFMVWGHNIKSMKTSRKLGRVKAQAVEVVSYNPDAPPDQRTIRARYPATLRDIKILEKGEGKVDEIKTIVVHGIRDKARLAQIAAGVHHSIARQEVSVQVDTDDMASYIDPTSAERHNDTPDLLRLRPGSPCRVAVARLQQDPSAPLVVSPLSDIFDKRTTELARFLAEQNGRFARSATALELGTRPNTDEMLRRISTSLASAKLTDIFYCRSIRHMFTADAGFSATMELVNYIEARSDAKVLSKKDQETVDKLKLPEKRGLVAPSVTTDQKKRAAVAKAITTLQKKN